MTLIAAEHEVVDLRALTTVGGDLTLLLPLPRRRFNNQNVIFRSGLPLLDSVDRGRHLPRRYVQPVRERGADADPRARRLRPSAATSSGDVNAFSFFASVVSIGGHLIVDHGPSTQSDYLRLLETVGGDATLSNGVWISGDGDGNGRMYRNLVSVGGALTISGAFLSAPGGDDLARALDSLTSAAALDWEAGGGFGGIGSAAIAVGDLRLHDDDTVTDIDAGHGEVRDRPGRGDRGHRQRQPPRVRRGRLGRGARGSHRTRDDQRQPVLRPPCPDRRPRAHATRIGSLDRNRRS